MMRPWHPWSSSSVTSRWHTAAALTTLGYWQALTVRRTWRASPLSPPFVTWMNSQLSSGTLLWAQGLPLHTRFPALPLCTWPSLYTSYYTGSMCVTLEMVRQVLATFPPLSPKAEKYKVPWGTEYEACSRPIQVIFLKFQISYPKLTGEKKRLM